MDPSDQSPGPAVSSKICWSYDRNEYCKRKNCKYSHLKSSDSASTQATGYQARQVRNGYKGKRGLSTSEKELREWKHSMHFVHFNYESFFKKARKLIEVDAGTLQSVIQALAEETGLQCVRDLMEQNLSFSPLENKKKIFRNQVLPLLETITYPNVLASLVLEKSVGTIYSFMFGIDGQRAANFLSYICDVLSDTIPDTNSNQHDSALGVCFLFFSRIVELNSTALVQEHIHVQERRFENLLVSAEEKCISTAQARVYLERLQQYMHTGNSLPHPVSSTVHDPSQVKATCFIHREGPGGRHDNDHADICQIQILPTSEEISSMRSEYLPLNDPGQWHLAGIDGMLDRNFRLLREDTVGQLRDVVHQVVQSSQLDRSNKSQLRRNCYNNVEVSRVKWDERLGLQVEIALKQPPALNAMSIADRKLWWQTSKRLQPGALVCLVTYNCLVLFCTVVDQSRPRRDNQKATEKTPDSQDLWTHKAQAFTTFALVDSTESNIKILFDLLGAKKIQFSVVEFPGVMLAAFESTLKGLQSMKEIGNVPLSNFLIPRSDGNWCSIDPPVYTARPGFTFNLSCLMKSRADFLVPSRGTIDLDRLCADSSLDYAQADALVNCLQRKLGLIQGPPGTGKSFTGVALIKVLLESKRHTESNLGPIICVTYTNHALDQLLETLIDQGITTRIIRIGSQSKSEKLKQFSLNNAMEDTEKTKTEREQAWIAHSELVECDQEFNGLHIGQKAFDARLKSHLQSRYPDHYQQLFEEDEKGFKLTAASKTRSLFDTWKNQGPSRADTRPVQELCQSSVFHMSREERSLLFELWVREIRDDNFRRLLNILKSHAAAKSQLDCARDEQHLRCLSQADIIGVTTTGLARKHSMLRMLQSKVLLCEEAGEVLEAHSLTSLLPSVEHAILIGDHLQLPPRIQNYAFSRENQRDGYKYSLDVSLFERLVDSGSNAWGCGIPFSTLKLQRRMHPSIAELIRQPLYPDLQDDSIVSEYPEVSGMRKRLFWLDHRELEGQSSKDAPMSTSHWNYFEVEMALCLVNHLVRQGCYREEDIAVLTPYLGQLHRLRQRLRQCFALIISERDQDDLNNAGLEDTSQVSKASLIQTLRVATVDNFQGEEAKVVIVSLVRSNKENNCGFLRTPNRINVLLSRAKHGMYIIGNSQTSSHIPMWTQVLTILRQGNNLGKSLELRCPRHPDTLITVSRPDDFLRLSPEGGCDLRCVKRLGCGHPCVQKCHSDILHDAVYCPERCVRPQKGCHHPCPRLCGDSCPERCLINIFKASRVLKCGHLMPNVPCWQDQDPTKILCPVPTEKVVPGCNHTVTVPCHVDVEVDQYRCTVICCGSLLCGHTCKRRCTDCRSEGYISQVDHGTCRQQCGRRYTTCAHACTTACHGSEPCPPCQAQCAVFCGHSRCPKKCHEPCVPCAEDKCLSKCPHSACSMPCAAPCDHVPCSMRCNRLLGCGHPCPSLCGEKCPSSDFCQICGDESIQNHEADLILGQVYMDIDLDENPCIFPQCGHFLTMESMDGLMGLGEHYVLDYDGRPTAIIASSQPFSMEGALKTCARCRGPLRDIARYGRLIRRALLDESTKKLILYLNREYIPLAAELPELIRQLKESEIKIPRGWPMVINIGGSRIDQIRKIQDILKSSSLKGPQRWKNILDLRRKVIRYQKVVAPEEQPFQKVRDMVVISQRRKNTAGNFEIESSILQTKGILQATALGLRLDIALIADFLAISRKGRSNTISISLDDLRRECTLLIEMAGLHKRPAQQVEGHVFLAQLFAMELAYISSEQRILFLELANASIATAASICSDYAGQTRGLNEEVEATRSMLQGDTFYTLVTSNERLEIITAMAHEFTGTGHWYNCPNGHPFTIGECGGAMELAVCPECGERVGGEHHQTTEGVTRAADIEEDLARLDL